MFNKIFLFVLIFVCSTNLSAKNKLDGMSIYLLGKFNLSPEGTVSDLNLATSKFPEIDKKLNQQISTWKFKPVVIDGKVMQAQVELDVLLDVALDANGQQKSVQIASVQFELLNGPKYEPLNYARYGFHNIQFPYRFLNKAEADALVTMSFKPDGSVVQLGINYLRIFPLGREGLSELQLKSAKTEFSNAIFEQRPFLGFKPERMPKDLNCMEACSVMIHFNLPPEGRFRKWRGYQKVELERLEWLENIDSNKTGDSQKTSSLQNYDQYIILIYPMQSPVDL